MSLVACVIMVEVTSAKGAEPILPEDHDTIKAAIDSELPGGMMVVAMMSPDECRLMLTAHIETITAANRHIRMMQDFVPTGYQH